MHKLYANATSFYIRDLSIVDCVKGPGTNPPENWGITVFFFLKIEWTSYIEYPASYLAYWALSEWEPPAISEESTEF